MRFALTPFYQGRLSGASNDQGPGLFSLHRQIDRLFDEFTRDLAPSSADGTGFVPKLNIAETEKEYHISAELPGVDERNVEATLTDGVLTIKGSKQFEKEEKEKNYHRREMSYGSFERSISLPEEVEDEKIAATFKNGILDITIPKRPNAKTGSKKIAIKAA